MIEQEQAIPNRYKLELFEAIRQKVQEIDQSAKVIIIQNDDDFDDVIEI